MRGTTPSPPPITEDTDTANHNATPTDTGLQSPTFKQTSQLELESTRQHAIHSSQPTSRKEPIALLDEEVEQIHSDDCSGKPTPAIALQVLRNDFQKHGHPSIDLQDLAYLVLEACADVKSDEVEIKRYSKSGSCINQKYMKLKKSRTLKDNATDKSRKIWVREKANNLTATVDGYDPKIKRMVLNQMAKKHGYLLVAKDEAQFSASQLIAIRDHVGTGTNGMYRVKQAVEALSDPILKGFFFPPNIRKLISEEEKKGVVPVKCVELNCFVTKKGNRQNMCTFNWIVKPGHLLETMINRMLLDGTYQDSFMFSSLHDTIVVVAGIDKSEHDLVGTWRVCNREEGNSSLYVQAFACLEGPVSENWENEKNSFFSPAFPTGNFIRKLIDDYLQCLIFTVGAGSKLDNTPSNSICAIFVPIPSQAQCEKRHFDV